MPVERNAAEALPSSSEGGPPKVSIVVPTHKASSTLLEAVTSLLEQDFHDLEVIVVDDACPERSSTVLGGLRDPRLRVIRLESNRGLSGARNAGIEVSRARYVAFLDADDTSLPDRIRKQADLLDRYPRVGLVGGLHNRTDLSGRLTHRAQDIWRVPDTALRPLLLFTNPFTSAVMIRRSALPRSGYRTMLCEDYAMVSDVGRTHEIAMVHSAIINYRSNPSGIMSAKREAVYDGARTIQKELLSRLGVPDSDMSDDLLFPRRRLGELKSRDEKFSYFHRYRHFLKSVLSANAISKVYRVEDLNTAISSHWTNLVLDAARGDSGLPLGMQFLHILADFWPMYDGRSRSKALVHSFNNSLHIKTRGALGS